MQWQRSRYSNCEVEACIQQILLPYWLVVMRVMDGGGDLQLKLWKWSYHSTGTAAHMGRNLARQQLVMLDAWQFRWILKNSTQTYGWYFYLQDQMWQLSSRSYSAASHHRRPCSTLVSSRSSWWWMKWQLDKFFSKYFSSPLSVFHLWSMLIHSFMPSLKPYDLSNRKHTSITQMTTLH